MDHCDECGFVYASVSVDAIGDRVRDLAARYGARLISDPAMLDALRRHPSHATWSSLEYACHVRDVLEVQRDRILLALEEEQPEFAPMGREERVLDLRYNEQDPAAVADAIDRHAESFAETTDALTPAQWQRTAIYAWPTREVRTLAWVARNVVHEGQHHLLDMDRSLSED